MPLLTSADRSLAAQGRGATVTRSFQGPSSGAEHYLAVEPPAGLDLSRQIARLEEEYEEALRRLDLAPETAIFRRIFLSDVLNQAPVVTRSGLVASRDDGPVAVSIVQQPPLSGAKIALLAYHADGPGGLRKRRLSPNHVLVERNGIRHLWSTRLCAGACDGAVSAADQTRQVFGELIEMLSAQGGTLRDHCVRTWIYLKDVDVFYKAMVESRRALFGDQGLGRDTHFIASTGIEGACAHQFDVVAMDAYSVPDLVAAQVSHLNAPDRLCPTIDYGVTFERATRIAYRDRAHVFVSGTASIDGAGRVVHLGDVLRQLDRALENVEALLRSGGSSIGDLTHLVVYLRDPTDFAAIDAEARRRFPDLPLIVVQGAVCRPDWLVEVEGIAVAPNDNPVMPAF